MSLYDHDLSLVLSLSLVLLLASVSVDSSLIIFKMAAIFYDAIASIWCQLAGNSLVTSCVVIQIN